MLKIHSDMQQMRCKLISEGSLVQTLTEFCMAAMTMQQDYQRDAPELGEAVMLFLTSDTPGSFVDQMRKIFQAGPDAVLGTVVSVDVDAIDQQLREEKENG